MKKLFFMLIFLILASSTSYAGQYSGVYSRVDLNNDKCDFIGDAKLTVNFKNLKIKVKKWRWDDSLPYKEKFFKGKFRKNYIDIFMQARGLGYKHKFEGLINNGTIFLTFSSTHTEMNEKFGGCKFEFVKD